MRETSKANQHTASRSSSLPSIRGCVESLNIVKIQTKLTLTAAIANYQKHISADLPAKLDKAKESIDNHFSYILKATQTLPDQIKVSTETLFVPLSETALAINIAATGHTYSQPLGKRFEDFQAVVKKQKENLNRLQKQHEDVLARLGLLKRAIFAGDSVVGEDQGGIVSYADKAREIQERFQVERERVLKKFQVNKDTLLGRINNYEAVSFFWRRLRVVRN